MAVKSAETTWNLRIGENVYGDGQVIGEGAEARAQHEPDFRAQRGLGENEGGGGFGAGEGVSGHVLTFSRHQVFANRP